MERGGNLREFEKWVLNLHETRFDIWAMRGCQIVWDENDLRIYDSWLSSYAQDYLNRVVISGRVKNWPSGVCPIPSEFRSVLIERVNHWKAVARRVLAEIRKHAAAQNKTTQNPPAENNGKTTQVVESKPIKEAAAPFTHSEDYRSVTIRGETFPLTSRQAQFIEILHQAHANGNWDVSIDFILEKLETPNSRWQDTFKSNADAKKALITAGKRKGTLRLNL
jgi:hypothetical protein